VSKYYLRIIFLIVLLNGCQRNIESQKIQKESIALDSIQKWIQEINSQIASTTFEKKLLFQKIMAQAESLSNDTLKTGYFAKLSLEFSDKDSFLFRRVNQKALEFARETKDTIILAEAQWDLAYFYQLQNTPDSAYFYYDRALKLFTALKDDLKAARMLYSLAKIQHDIKDFTGGEITAIKALEIFKKVNDNLYLYRCYNLLGSIAIGLKEYDRALEYFNEALAYLNKQADNNFYNETTQNNIGMVYQEKGQHQNALPYFKAVIDNDSLLEKNPKLYATAFNNYAYSRFKTNEITNVELEMKRSLAIRDSINDASDISKSHYALAQYYLGQKDSTQAFYEALLAKTFAEKSQNNERLLATLQLLMHVDPKNSAAYTQEYIILNDSLQQEERKLRDKFARVRFETDTFIAENETLSHQKKVWTGIAVGLLLLGLAIFIITDQRLKNQKLRFLQQQQATNQEIFNMMLSQTQKIEEGKKMEQKRISEELHDGVLGKMLGARMVLTGLNKKTDPEAQAERASAIAALKDVEAEVRAISHELSHAAYRDLSNFINSVNELLQSIEKASEIKITFQHDKKLAWDRLNGETKINLYRIIQESVQNAVKHAQCKHILINFAVDGDKLRLQVEDDGRGFDTAKKKNGIGMRNISSRIKSLGGTWTLTSEPTVGTKIVVSVPVIFYNNASPDLDTDAVPQEIVK
jgi:signal transduction histidine kinase